MKHFCYLLVLNLLPGITLAQSVYPGKLIGSLTDSTTAKPVPFVTVALMDGTKLITGTTSESDGSFILSSLPLGSYTLTLSYVGYRTKHCLFPLQKAVLPAIWVRLGWLLRKKR